MPPLTDPVILGQFQAVLANWNYTGYVTAKDVALDWIANELGGLKLKHVAKAMYDFLQGGGVIDQIPETRPEWSLWPCHYDFRFPIAGRNVYIEVILQDDDPRDPTIHLVSIHDA
jgi:hypothetical protein